MQTHNYIVSIHTSPRATLITLLSDLPKVTQLLSLGLSSCATRLGVGVNKRSLRLSFLVCSKVNNRRENLWWESRPIQQELPRYCIPAPQWFREVVNPVLTFQQVRKPKLRAVLQRLSEWNFKSYLAWDSNSMFERKRKLPLPLPTPLAGIRFLCDWHAGSTWVYEDPDSGTGWWWLVISLPWCSVPRQRAGAVKGCRAPRTHSLVSQQENASQRPERLGFVGAVCGSLDWVVFFSASQQPWRYCLQLCHGYSRLTRSQMSVSFKGGLQIKSCFSWLPSFSHPYLYDDEITVNGSKWHQGLGQWVKDCSER